MEAQLTASRLPVPLNDLHALKIVVREQGAPIPIELHGEWDLANGPAVRQAIARVFDGVS